MCARARGRLVRGPRTACRCIATHRLRLTRRPRRAPSRRARRASSRCASGWVSRVRKPLTLCQRDGLPGTHRYNPSSQVGRVVVGVAVVGVGQDVLQGWRDVEPFRGSRCGQRCRGHNLQVECERQSNGQQRGDHGGRRQERDGVKEGQRRREKVVEDVGTRSILCCCIALFVSWLMPSARRCIEAAQFTAVPFQPGKLKRTSRLITVSRFLHLQPRCPIVPRGAIHV